jgi:hypothetical protein
MSPVVVAVDDIESIRVLGEEFQQSRLGHSGIAPGSA